MINVVSSDPFNQKQVEVDAAVNPRNPNHIVAGYIDYQVVPNENPLLEPTSSAWCGLSFTTNGRTWKNSLVPGFPADTSTAGRSSPIFGNAQCGDPSVAWDTNGHLFFEGMAEMSNGNATLFVSRFTDPDDGSGNLIYDFTVVIATGNPSGTGQNLDKPSLLFVPDSTPGSSPSAGTLFACGTIFDGTIGGKFRNKVLCGLSSDGGVTFTKPNQGKYNGNVNTNNGTALAPAPDGGVYLFWRAFLGTENGYWYVKIDRAGNATTPVQAVGPANFYPYDVPTLSDLARSNAFPSVATDAAGRILLAFQAYSNSAGAMTSPTVGGSPRVFLTYLSNGGSWSTPLAVDYAGPGAFQFMPRIATGGGGTFQILYYDARNDGRGLNAVSGGYFPSGRDRRYDVRVIQGQFDNAGLLSLAPGSAQVSQYPLSSKTGQIMDRMANCPNGCPALLYPNLPIAAGGTVPFIGDYIAIVSGVPLVRNPVSSTLPAWRFANQAVDPVKYFAFFTSTQDVGFPLNSSQVPDINGDWTKFSPAGFQSCVNPKTRDSNIYFSAISPGLVASWHGPSKKLVNGSVTVPPQFTVTVENRSNQNGYYRLTIQDSATEDWSFLQTPPSPNPIPADKNTVDTQILRNSSISLPVYYRFRSPGVNPTPSGPVQVQVQQIDSIGGSVLNNGFKTSITYSLTADTLQLDNLQIDNLQLDNTQPSNLQLDNLQIDNASPSNLQIDNLQVDNLQIDNTLVPDQDVTWTLNGNGNIPTPGNLITNLENGLNLLNNNYQFQILIYQTQNNPGVNGCSLVQVPTDIVISNIAITNPNVQNLQIDNLQVDNLQVDNTAISDPQASNATFVLGKNDKLKITLRTFKKSGSPSADLNPLNLGQAVFSQATNPDGTRSSSFFDLTPPKITAVVTGTLGNNGWYRSPVTVKWTVRDTQSGVVSATGCADTTLSSDTTGTTINCSAVNRVGLTGTGSVTIKIDMTPPVINITTPANNAAYVLNSVVTANYTCTDPTSGIATCSGPVANGANLNTSAVGANTFTVNAADAAGNTATLTYTYAVVYNFTIVPPKTGTQLGSAVPLNWTLTDANGQMITDTSSLTSLYSVFNGKAATCVASTGPGPTAILYSPATGATGGSNLRVNSSTGFTFNWDTSTATATGAGCYTVVFQLKDNSSGPPSFGVLDQARLKLVPVQLN